MRLFAIPCWVMSGASFVCGVYMFATNINGREIAPLIAIAATVQCGIVAILSLWFGNAIWNGLRPSKRSRKQ